MTVTQPNNEFGRTEGFLDFLIVLAQNKRYLIGIPFLVGCLVAVVLMFVPNVYKASTRILPPQQAQSGAAALLAQLGGVAGAAAGAAGIKNPNDLYVGMLKSRTISNRIIKRFDLMKVYEAKLLEDAQKELERNTFIQATKDGLITVSFEDESAKRAVEIADAYVSELLTLTKAIAVTEAGQRRIFFQRELEASKTNLFNAETALRKNLNTNGVVSVDSESRAIVEIGAKLRAHIAAKEIQLSSLRGYLTGNSFEVRKAEFELSSMRAELARLEQGQGGTSGSVTAQGLESMKYLRDLKYHQMLYELLSKQYEIARLDEAKDASIVQVLDPAQLPEKKVRPLRAIWTITAMFITFLAVLSFVFISRHFKSLARLESCRTKINFLRQTLRFKN